jgi:phenylpyruvate tautomerase PptA (4-oxalocrotonate tautomerase family)
MPYIDIQTSSKAGADGEIVEQAAAAVSGAMDKPITLVAAGLSRIAMAFKGSGDAAIVARVTSLEPIPITQSRAVTTALTELLADGLQVPQARIWVVLEPVSHEYWGAAGNVIADRESGK